MADFDDKSIKGETVAGRVLRKIRFSSETTREEVGRLFEHIHARPSTHNPWSYVGINTFPSAITGRLNFG